VPVGSLARSAGIVAGSVALGVALTVGVAAPTPASAATAPPKFDHIVIVMEENHSFGEIIGSSSAPYINSLPGQGALFTQSFAVSHPASPTTWPCSPARRRA